MSPDRPSKRWTWEMRNSSMWPLKGSAMPLTCRPIPRGAELRSMGIAHLRDARTVEIETLVGRAGVLVAGADDIAQAPFSRRARDIWLQHGHSGQVCRIMTMAALLDEVGTPRPLRLTPEPQAQSR
jgi:hypothetical protein